MKLSCMHMLLIICLCVSATSVLAQTSAPVTVASKEDSGNPPLPYAPSAVRKSEAAAPAPIVVPVTRDKYFMLVNGLMFGSSIADAELTTRCLISGACTALPGPLRSRATLYGVGLPIDVTVAVMTYRFKRSGRRWWFVPAAAVTAGNIIYSIHAVRYTH